MTRLAFHEALGLLGVGDLHPGEAAATQFLLDRLAEANPSRVLEVGAGIGATTARLRARGWQVSALEPSPVLRREHEARLGVAPRATPLERLDDPDGSYDAIVAESVLYGADLGAAFGAARRLLRPGGLLALVDLVWTDAADPAAAALLHDRTKARLGIAVASRARLTWTDWRHALEDGGFSLVEAAPAPSAPPAADARRMKTILAHAVRHPLALAQHLTYRHALRHLRIPAGWTEAWASVWRRRDTPRP